MHITQEMANRYPSQQSQMQPRIDLLHGTNVPPMFPRPRAGMWPHHSPHQQLVEEQSEKQREYLKQQQKLRLMTATSTPQTVSADALIENLLGRKETFKPKSSHGFTSGSTSGNQHMFGNIGVPVQIPGLAPSHLGTTVRTAAGYPIPSTATIPAGPSSTSMMTGYTTSVMTLEAKGPYSQVPMILGNKGYAAASRINPQIDVNVQSQAQFPLNIPSWLTPSSQQLPQFYQQVWKLVGQDKGLVDTTRIFPLLLTSGLPTDILGFIWGLANRKIAGQLTEQELYIVLALVALAQSGCTFNNLSVLNLIPQAPIPNLKLVGFESPMSAPCQDSEDITTAPGQGKMRREELNFHMVPSSASSIPAPSSGGDDTEFDDFTEFQSAVATESSTSSIKEQISVSKSEIPNSTTITLPSNVISEIPTVQKCPSVMVVSSSGNGRGIGSRLANHSLGTPKQKKTKHHHHHHHHRSQSQATVSITSSMDEDFTEFQQAKELVTSAASTGEGIVDEMFQKCMLKGIQQGKTYLLKESAIRTELKEGNQQDLETVKDVGGHVPREESRSGFEQLVPREKTSVSPEKSQLEGGKEDQQVTSELERKSAVLAPEESKSEGINLMSIEEDKYSALRNLSLGGQETSPDKQQLFKGTEQSPVSDEFGDFLSAEPAQVIDDSFADIATREQNLVDVAGANTWKAVESPQTAEFEVDDWGDYKGAPVFDTGTNSVQPLDIASKWDNAVKDIETDKDLSTACVGLNVGNDSNNLWDTQNVDNGLVVDKKEDRLVFPSFAEPSTDLNIVSSWDFKLKDDSDNPGDTHANASERAGHSSSFQGFLGKIYDDDDVKNEQYSSKMDVFCSSPDDQLHDGRNENFDIDVQNHGGDDDFGEFVGSDTWSEEQKYNTTTKDMLFDGHLGSVLKDGLYGDSQSVSSLELPPLALSRHGSVPSLDLKIFLSTADKNGGNGGNQPWDLSPQGIDHQLSEWQRCLQSCLTLLQSAVETFNNISCGAVLDEVIGSSEGKDYLCNLLEVAGVSHRVECSYKQLGNSSDYKQLDSLLADIDTAWSSLESYYLKADISVDLELDMPVGSGDVSAVVEQAVCCGVCLTDVCSGVKRENRNTSQLEYGGHIYHSVCANLWVNCVDSSLPALATGNSNFL